jgi:hypothetical protein
MSENLKDILSGLSKDIDQETLLLYLQGKLTEEKKNEVEKKIMESEFDSDAIEGLEQFRNKKDLSTLVDQLNLDLQKKIRKKKERRRKLQLKEQPWLYFAILMVIFLIIISYLVLHRLLKDGS